MSAIRKLNARMLEGAQRYAAFDKNDPFAMQRMVAHMKNGVASVGGDKPAYYDAEEHTEQRSYMQDGREVKFNVTRHHNVVRP